MMIRISNRATFSSFPLFRFVGMVSAVGFRSALSYRSEFFIWILTTNMPLIMLLLWSSVARDAPIGGYGSREFVSYFLAVLIVRILSGSWVVWQIHEEMQSGKLNLRLIHPVHPFLAYFSEHLGYLPLRLLFLTPAIGIFLWTYSGSQNTPLPALFLFPGILLQSWMIQFFAMACIGSLALFWERALGLFDLWLTSYFAFSGYLVPLDLFPDKIRIYLEFLPFRYLLSFPVDLLLRRLSLRDTIFHLVVQSCYLSLFILLSLSLWRFGRRRYMALGA
jgi:ABC-2 type transport system permease protein